MIKLMFWMAILHILPLFVFGWSSLIGLDWFTHNQFLIAVFMFAAGVMVIAGIDMSKELNKHSEGKYGTE